MISVSGRVMAGVVLVTILVSGWFTLRLLWPPIPSDKGLAVMQDAFPDSAVVCLIDSITAQPGRFQVDDSFYLEPFNERVFYLHDRNSRHAVSFSTERHVAFQDFYGQTGLVSYGPC